MAKFEHKGCSWHSVEQCYQAPAFCHFLFPLEQSDTETAVEQCYQASQHDFKPRQWSLRREVRCEHGFRSLLESGFWTFPKFQKLRLWNPLPERVTLPSVWACSEIQNKNSPPLKILTNEPGMRVWSDGQHGKPVSDWEERKVGAIIFNGLQDCC